MSISGLAVLDAFGADARLHHVGIAVKSIAAARPDLTAIHDPIQRVRVAFFRLHDLTVELVEPVGTDSPVWRSLTAGVKLLHTCYEVDSLEEAIAAGRRAAFALIRPPMPAVAFDGRRIVWVYHRALGLVELLEREQR